MKKIANILDTVICGDCLEVMRELPDNCVDLVLTDPPYNAKDIGPNRKTYSVGQMQLPLAEYKTFCAEWFTQARRIGRKLVFTPGIANLCYYPQPYWICCWHKPAAVSFNRMGGFNAWEPVCIYNKPCEGERLGQDYFLCNTLNLKKGPEAAHPCPKPIKFVRHWITKFSQEGDVVLDCFAGSGTTLVVCEDLKRHFIGVEINPDYCKIAEKRIQQERDKYALLEGGG